MATAFAILMALQAIAIPSGGAPGKIIMYRPDTVQGLASACPIRFKGQEIVELGRGKFAEWAVQPGRYILSNKASSLEVDVNPGETRYVRCHMKNGGLTYRANLEIAEENDFNQRSTNLVKTDLELAGSGSNRQQ